MSIALANLDVGGGQVATIWRSEDGAVHWAADQDAAAMRHPPATFAVRVPAGLLVAGEMPAGAVFVEVRRGEPAREVAVAGGLFLALLDGEEQGEAFVIFRDAAGAIVAAPAAGELKRTALEEPWPPCPACGASDCWDVVELRAPPGAPTTRLAGVVCRACGRPEADYGPAGRRRGPPAPEPEPDNREPADIVAGARFPVYGVVAEGFSRGSLIGWDANGEYVRLVFAAQRSGRRVSVDVISDARRVPFLDPDVERRARGALAGRVLVRVRAERDAAKSLKEFGELDVVRAALERVLDGRLEAELGAVPVRALALPVDGTPEEFALAEHGTVWAAAARLAGTGVLLIGQNIDPSEIALTRLHPGEDRVRPRYPELG